MKFYELLELPTDELKIRLQNAQLDLANLRFQKAIHQIENPLLIRERRREIAKIQTLLKEYERGKRVPKQTIQSTEGKEKA